MKRPLKRRIKLAPIVSTAKSAMVICKMWDQNCHTAPDLSGGGRPAGGAATWGFPLIS